MTHDIRIGRWQLRGVESVNVKRSVSTLYGEATIVMACGWHDYLIRVDSYIHAGDAVSIRLGYDGTLNDEFVGYVQKVGNDGENITIECIDELYRWGVAVADAEYVGITLKQLLEKLAMQVDNGYKIACDYDFRYDKFTVFKAKALDVLKKVQEDTRANIYFKGDTLHIHPQYTQMDGAKAVVFDFGVNIEEADLTYVKAEDKKVEVAVSYIDAEGKKKEREFGQSGGETVHKTVSGVPESELMKVAENEYNLWNYDGYEGSFTGWLEPYVEPNQKVRIRDAEQEYKDGVYYVEATEVEYGSGGGKRKISLGRRLG